MNGPSLILKTAVISFYSVSSLYCLNSSQHSHLASYHQNQNCFKKCSQPFLACISKPFQSPIANKCFSPVNHNSSGMVIKRTLYWVQYSGLVLYFYDKILKENNLR